MGEDGSRLRHVSPSQVRHSQKFAEIITEIEAIFKEAQHKKGRPQFSALQEKAQKPRRALGLFEQLSYDPGRPGTENRWLVVDFIGMRDSWEGFTQALSPSHPLTVQPDNLRLGDRSEQALQLLQQKLQPCLLADQLQREVSQLVEKTGPVMQEFVTRWSSIQDARKPVRGIESVAARLRRLISDLDVRMHDLADTDLPDAALLIPDDTAAIRSNRQNFCRWTKSLALQAAQLPWPRTCRR